MLNFDYLKQVDALATLHGYCDMAEQRQTTEPETSALYARRALDWIVKIVYRLKNVPIAERASLFELTDGETFRDFIDDPEIMKRVHWVRKVGNATAHDGHVTKTEAYYSVWNLYDTVKAILIKLRVFESIAPFDKSLLPSCHHSYNSYNSYNSQIESTTKWDEIDEINVLEIFPGKAKQVADFVANLHKSIFAA